MNENEEMVYSSMGLDPILLLEEPPLSENYTVNIIRPGVEAIEENKNAILEETQQNSLINANTKNKKNHKDIIRRKNDTPIEQKPTNPEEVENVEKETTNVDLDANTNELISIEKNPMNEKDELSSTESQEVNDDPRRKRRRSSASS